MNVGEELQSIGVRFDDEAFSFRGNTYPFTSVQNVSYLATRTRHSVNGIPTGTTFSAKCRVYFANGGSVLVDTESGWGFGKQKTNIPPVWLFHELLSAVTFDQRLARYEEAIGKRKYVQWDCFQIHKDGSVFKRAKLIGSLKNKGVRLAPFHLNIESGTGFGNGEYQIPADVDRDCLLYILRHYHNIQFANENVRERQGDKRRKFFEAIVTLAAKIAKADGQVSSDEIAVFRRHFETEKFPLENVAEVFNRAVKSQSSVVDIANEIAEWLDDPMARETLLVGLIKIAAVDDVLHPAERAILESVADAFEIEHDTLEHLIAIHASRATRDRYYEQTSSRRTRRGPAEQAVEFLKCLNLDLSATPSEVKAAYRSLTPKFHPDLLRSKGIPDEIIKLAEENLKAINNAYDWLRRNGYAN